MSTAQPADQPQGPLVPDGPISGAQFWRLAWKIVRARALALVPAAAVLGAVSAGIQEWVLIRAAGSAHAAIAAQMNPAQILSSVMAPGHTISRGALFAVVAGLVVTTLVIPSVAYSSLISVVDGAIHDRPQTAARPRTSITALPKVIAAQVLQTIIAVGPVSIVYIVIGTNDLAKSSLFSGIEVLVAMPLAFLAFYLTIGWYFSPQAIVIGQLNPIAAMRASARLARGRRWRITRILLATLLVSGFLALVVANPITWLGTLNGGSAAGPTLGSQLVSAYIGEWAQQSVTILSTATVLTLLYTDLRRRTQGAQ